MSVVGSSETLLGAGVGRTILCLYVAGMAGHYFYGDYVDGYVRSAVIVNGVVSAQQDWTSTLGNQTGLASFGVDGHGERYILNLFSGTVQKFVPAGQV